MSFSRQEIDALARLARLDLTADQHALFARQLGDIVDYARQVSTVDTAELARPTDPAGATALRADVVTPSLERADVLAAAPLADADTGLIKVPRVLG